MRVIIGVLACLGAGSALVALADPPASAPQQSAAAPSPSAPTAPAATASAAKAELGPEEKRLLAMGYKLRLRHGERVFCRSEEELGTRLGAREICGTAKDLALRQTATREDAEDLRRQSLRVVPVGK